MFIVVLTIHKEQKNNPNINQLMIDEWINKPWYVYTMEYSSPPTAKKQNINACYSINEP